MTKPTTIRLEERLKQKIKIEGVQYKYLIKLGLKVHTGEYIDERAAKLSEKLSFYVARCIELEKKLKELKTK